MNKQLFLALALLPTCACAKDAPNPVLQPLNTKLKFPAYCVAASRLPDTTSPGGYASSGNLPHPVGGMKVK